MCGLVDRTHCPDRGLVAAVDGPPSFSHPSGLCGRSATPQTPRLGQATPLLPKDQVSLPHSNVTFYECEPLLIFSPRSLPGFPSLSGLLRLTLAKLDSPIRPRPSCPLTGTVMPRPFLS